MAHDAATQSYKRKGRIDKMVRPIQRFMEIESSSGILLLISTMIALICANTSLAGWFQGLWKTEVGFHWGSFELTRNLQQVINDGLMTVFFFVVGLEIKRECTIGELTHWKSACFPLFGAIGGMLVPALVYFAIAGQGQAAHGWGIPMATDIAFVVGFLSLLGTRVPHSLKVFLLSLAIIDDMAAILVIAIFYGHAPFFLALGFAALGIGLIILARYLEIRSIGVYVILGLGLWMAFLQSGIHPTIAGVILGLLTPSRAWIAEEGRRGYIKMFLQSKDRRKSIDALELIRVTREAVSPLERCLFVVHPWVAFLVMPLFALANAGVPVEISALQESTTWAVSLGLLIGKPIGILFVIWVGLRLNLAQMPDDLSWRILAGASCLAGIGFTMSLFISSLALQGDALQAAKVGAFLGSTLSACLGLALLNRSLRIRHEL